jgi:hypothetical protein
MLQLNNIHAQEHTPVLYSIASRKPDETHQKKQKIIIF